MMSEKTNYREKTNYHKNLQNQKPKAEPKKSHLVLAWKKRQPLPSNFCKFSHLGWLRTMSSCISTG